MNFSYTQVSQFLSCPRRYRYHYLDGWTEKDTRAAMLFGRAFEKALAAFFLRQDASETLFNEWASYRDLDLQYSANDNWDRMLQGGMQLLDRFAQEDRVRILQPQTNLQVKILRPLPGDHTFISYVDAIGELDNELCVIDWKTSTSCYPAEPAGLGALDPQMICYSWMTGIERFALVVFVRKRMPEIQYIKATISDQQAGLRPVGGGNGASDRGGAVPAAQRHTFSPEPVSELCLSWSLSRPAGDGRSQVN